MYNEPQKRNTMKNIIIMALSILGFTAQAQEETRMYDVKSGIVTMEMDMNAHADMTTKMAMTTLQNTA